MSDKPTTDEPENMITAYCHCSRCMGMKPQGMSPRDWASLEVGLTLFGIQIWCRRCDKNVAYYEAEFKE